MREFARIDRINSLLGTLWKYHPDLRYFQFVSWVQYEFSKAHNNYGRVEIQYRGQHGQPEKFATVDLFNLEDDRLETWLTRQIQLSEQGKGPSSFYMPDRMK